MQLILATLLLPLSLTLPVPLSKEAPTAEESIIPPNSCLGVCAKLSSPVCGRNADGVLTTFNNACLLRKANCDGLSLVQVPLEECSDTQVTRNNDPDDEEEDGDGDNALETADHPFRPPKGYPGKKKGHKKGNKKDNSKGKKKGKKVW
ncbi:uncharacterized protein ASPGLDRAFT_54702 [Aspergillus glaucus CBS 516.65]|uniref:Kazal-like domain-containing protein n=1 Tax=Aspergillus glaucus CBS 516.65 TaxID=1160497 RepID=A0A1L9VXV7_ASPGL|nr:hypothetical protein ASPGLDRAFT_54702 [Aspergillus glaucus CBS 516.65]OJJ88707.1 hypothetical protein ASPGLDRAFT_54702 [Aspergillus glaucus CBS 516.65]